MDAVLQGRTLNTNTWPPRISHAPTRRSGPEIRALTCLVLRNHLVRLYIRDHSALGSLFAAAATPAVRHLLIPLTSQEEACSGHCAVTKLETKSRPSPLHRYTYSGLSPPFFLRPVSISQQALTGPITDNRQEASRRPNTAIANPDSGLFYPIITSLDLGIDAGMGSALNLRYSF